MEYRARTDSNSLYFRRHNHLLLLLLVPLLLVSFPSTMGVSIYDGQPINDFGPIEDPFADPDHPVTQSFAAQYECKCPEVRECPSTLETKSLKQLKDNLAPVIRQRLLELSLTVKSATEAAHTLDLLKLLTESNSEHLDRIRDEVHEKAWQLRDALDKIPELI